MSTPARPHDALAGPGLWLGIALCATTIAGILTFPFEFGRNQVHWRDAGPGLFFDGRGIAHTAARLAHASGKPLDEMTFELWVRERPTPRGRGTGVVLSLYGGPSRYPVTLGIHYGQLFAFDPEEPWHGNWMMQFLSERPLTLGEEQFVAVTVDRAETVLFVGGEPAGRRQRPSPKPPDWLSGRLVVGNSPSNYQPWRGELRGLAVYAEVLSSADLRHHARQARRGGVRALAGDERLVALFPFDEGTRDLARNLVPGGPDLRIPAWFVGLPRVLLDVPTRQNFRIPSFLQNIPANVLLFAPLGFLLGVAVARAPADRRRTLALAAIAAGGVFSLGLEAAQLWLPTRQSALIDVATNTLGTALGVGAALSWRRRRPNRRCS